MHHYDPHVFHPDPLIQDYHDRPRDGPRDFEVSTEYLSYPVEWFLWMSITGLILFLAGLASYALVFCCGVGKTTFGTRRTTTCACVAMWVVGVAFLALEGAAIGEGVIFHEGYMSGMHSWRLLAEQWHESACETAQLEARTQEALEQSDLVVSTVVEVRGHYDGGSAAYEALLVGGNETESISSGLEEVKGDAREQREQLDELVDLMLSRSKEQDDDAVFADDDQVAHEAMERNDVGGPVLIAGDHAQLPGGYIGLIWVLFLMLSTLRFPICAPIHRCTLTLGLLMGLSLWLYAGTYLGLASVATDFCINPDHNMILVLKARVHALEEEKKQEEQRKHLTDSFYHTQQNLHSSNNHPHHHHHSYHNYRLPNPFVHNLHDHLSHLLTHHLSHHLLHHLSSPHLSSSSSSSLSPIGRAKRDLETGKFYFKDCLDSVDPSLGGAPNATARGVYGSMSNFSARIGEQGMRAQLFLSTVNEVYRALLRPEDYQDIHTAAYPLPPDIARANASSKATLPPIACTPIRDHWLDLLDATCNQGVALGLIPVAAIFTACAALWTVLCCAGLATCAKHPAEKEQETTLPDPRYHLLAYEDATSLQTAQPSYYPPVTAHEDVREPLL